MKIPMKAVLAFAAAAVLASGIANCPGGTRPESLWNVRLAAYYRIHERTIDVAFATRRQPVG
jgi:hypothetical protein